MTDLAAEKRSKIPSTGKAPKGYKDLRIVHWSAEVFDNDNQARADLQKIKSELRPHLLGGTESGDRDRKQVFHDVLDDKYIVVTQPGSDAWGAIRRSLVKDGKVEKHYEEILPSGKEAGDPHPYAAKGVLVLTFEHVRLGRVSWVPGTHYLTKGRWKGQAQQDKPHDPVDHVKANARLAGAFTDAMIEAAKGSAIAFGSADTNLIIRLQHEKVVAGRPVTACWKEVGHYPNTGHGNIDAVFSVDSDGRVRCIEAYVLDDKDFFLNGDHYVVVTVYRVRLLDA